MSVEKAELVYEGNFQANCSIGCDNYFVFAVVDAFDISATATTPPQIDSFYEEVHAGDYFVIDVISRGLYVDQFYVFITLSPPV